MSDPRGGPRDAQPGAAEPITGFEAVLADREEMRRVLDLADLDIGVGAHGEALLKLEAARRAAVSSPDQQFGIERRIAYCLRRLGRSEEARDAACRALELADASIPVLEKARCLIQASKASLELGHLPTARADARAVLEMLGAADVIDEVGVAHNLLGEVAFRSGDSELARTHFEKALEINRKLGELQHLAGTYMNLGLLHKLRCDWERAAEHYQVAYYLATTLGQTGIVTGAAQNLGVVLAKTGQLREARAYFERGLRLATESGDEIRQVRARLGLARMDRADFWTDRARAHLESCEHPGVTVPERERCLILLEGIRLDAEDGSIDADDPRLENLRLRVEAMAPRGDLMVEVLLLETDLASRCSRWDDAASAAAHALDIARHDRDRAQEERAQVRLAVAWAHSGRTGEAETALSALLERHRTRGEWPAVANTLAAQGQVLREVRGDHETALRCFREATEIHRRLGAGRNELLDIAEQAACLVRLARREEALAQIDELRRRHAESEPFSQLEKRLAEITASLHDGDGADLAQRPDGLKVHEQLEGILAASGRTWERLHEILSLLREALEVDGVFLARRQEDHLDVLASVGIDALRGMRSAAAEDLGIDRTGGREPRLSFDVDPKTPGRVGSRLTIPVELRGVPHVLFLRREPARGRSPMSRAESNYAMVLAAEIARALEVGSPHQEIAELAGGIALADVITQDPLMLRILDLIRRVGDTSLTVLLQGETGTGKKLMAHAIHRASGRRNRPFVTVDCAALPDSLLEAELFGYRKGAFTGAQQDRSGLLAEAAGGTVFLDEIDKAGLSVQRRFLHLLDSGEIRPVGSTSYVRLDVRIVCATSCPDLRLEVAEGRFLKDLYYRLNDISIQIPALRDRRDDILLLAGCFVETIAGQAGRRIRGMSGTFRRRLLDHDWPGNVRELEKAIRRAITLAEDDDILSPDLLPREIVEGAVDSPEQAGDQLRYQVETFERRAIQHALEVCEGNKSRAAALLGLSRKGLKGKIARYRIGSQSPPGA